MISNGRRMRRLRASREASRWLALLQMGDLSTEQRAEFIDWLRESHVHVAEMLHMCRQHRDLSSFTRWAQITGSANEAPGGQVVSFPLPDPVIADSTDEIRHRRPYLAAACVALLVLTAAIFFVDFGRGSKIQTQRGERREVTLADGSIVDLAPDSDLRVRFDARERRVSLERGEALFQVTKNPKRPFVVEAGDTRVRAVGTAFSVERKPTEVSITVVEGRVGILQTPSLAQDLHLSAPAAAAAELFLDANEQVVVSVARGAAPVQQVKGELEVAWANGNLVFEDETVGRIVERLNSYNHLQIRVVDPQVAKRRVSGMFRAGDPESFAAFIESAAGIRVQRKPDVIVLGAEPGNGGREKN